jgi:hypothetical protein
MTRLIEATMILHNWYIDLQALFDGPIDPQEEVRTEKWMYIGGDDLPPGSLNMVDGDVAEEQRRLLKVYLHEFVVVD